MANFNKVSLLGNLTRDPQMRSTPGGTAVAELGLAVNRQWFDKQSNQKKESTTFVDVVVWGRRAEICGEYLAQGRQVLVHGRLEQETWQDKETGQKRSRLKVVADEVVFLDGGQGGGQQGQGQGQRQQGQGQRQQGQGQRRQQGGGQQRYQEPQGGDYDGGPF